MIDISRLIEICEDLQLESITDELKSLAEKQEQENCPIHLPLVGEFSAGKTSLINALTDNHQLETATTPTTATIYEVHFGSEKSYAEIYNSSGILERRVEDNSSLLNEKLIDATLVKVFDTSKKVPSSVVIIDTPGLSSPNPKHRQALVDYLPKADGIVLVSDVNQQLTASLLLFIKTIRLTHRPIFLAITQCDLKSETEVNAARQYAATVSGIPMDNIVCVSAYKEQLKEIISLFTRIQSDKSKILKKVNAHRLSELKTQVMSILEDLVTSTKPNTNYDEAIKEQKNKYNSLKLEIDGLIENAKNEMEAISKNSVRKFEDQIFDQLDSLASMSGINFDIEAKSLIDSSVRVMFNEYKTTIQSLFSQKIHQYLCSDKLTNNSGLLGINLSEYELGEMPYSLNLNELGHKYDRILSTGIKLAAAAAITAATAGAATGTVGAAAVGTNAVGTAVQTAATLRIIKKGAEFISKTSDKYGEIEEKNRAHNERGALDSLIWSITDSSMGKPQRRRAIHQYVDNTLSPSYKQGLSSITSLIIDSFSDRIKSTSTSRLNEITAALQKAQKEQLESDTYYRDRIHILKSYQAEIIND